MQPNVRDLQSLIAEQQTGIKPQLDLVDQSISANDNSGAAQIAGLGAQQKQAFGQIEQGAQNKGMFFSGFTPDEQAKYTASTYLPALAQLQQTIAGTRANLLGKKADINKGAFDVATQQREGDRQVLADWNKMTAQQQFNVSEAEKQRVYDAGQNEANRNNATRIANIGASAQAAKAQGAPAGLVDGVSGYLNKYKGKDSFVSPETYRTGLQKWTNAGGSPNSYQDTFSGYINPQHQAKFGGYL